MTRSDDSSLEGSNDERARGLKGSRHKRKRSAETSSSSDRSDASSSDRSEESSEDSSSSADDARAAKRRKKEKKEKKKEKKGKKEKKRKKEKKKKKVKGKKPKKEKDFYTVPSSLHASNGRCLGRVFLCAAGSGCVTNQYGKYGILQESDMWKKRAEFSLWLMEVKDKNLEELSGWEEREMFKDFMEDFNTATLPSKKYYNLELFEAKQRMKKTNLQETRELTDFNDEARRKQEIKNMIDQRRKLEAEAQLRSMREDREKVDDMRQQKLLKSKVETLYRMGANAEAKKLADLINPEK
ncbi:hypothetical protein NCLIV_027620 [Neospora caninum Liverpool]|uniref:Uncharacterized protein n=1 Tax=Neospora caninum (strain Liverpool) TaxID=572307 RepID=F0VGX9_NEOCL|nr:hypothetical protein NCLIV_027620 [Neospora caninum Liverpool]CBZ52973.1 hypothetical protein NCLIV_027620 [Neospora caninum Liverpool]CEL66959.1 TPA: hypothetical protein BN1204_027620 [Neospora caninum Liverpool]|eukprot:XP_003883005.1 hypothetical protein NCLIV_027620 [Neospora caninum Liverpool]